MKLVSVNPTTSGCLSQSNFAAHSKPNRDSQVMVGCNTYVIMFPVDYMSCNVVGVFGFLVKSLPYVYHIQKGCKVFRYIFAILPKTKVPGLLWD